MDSDESLLDSHFVFYSVVREQESAKAVGLVRLELTTPRLSSVCSNQLSYRPSRSLKTKSRREKKGGRRIDLGVAGRSQDDSRKEVIQPQVPLRLPCYDFTPVTSHSLGTALLSVTVPRPCFFKARPTPGLLRKEVIQPQVPLRLPCYDFTPVTNHSLGTTVLW